MTLLDEKANGVFVIAATPFRDDGALDLASVDRMVDFYLDRGANGITLLGVIGEDAQLARRGSPRLSASRAGSGSGAGSGRGRRLGVRFAPMKELSARAMDEGAAASWSPRPRRSAPTRDFFSYYEAVAGTLGSVPFALQDYPLLANVQIPAAVILQIVAELPTCVMLKHEDWPGLAKIGALRAASDRGARRIAILVGNGELFLPEELVRGADGAMTGFAFPEMMVEVVRAHRLGDLALAQDVFEPWICPLRVMSSSLASGRCAQICVGQAGSHRLACAAQAAGGAIRRGRRRHRAPYRAAVEAAGGDRRVRSVGGACHAVAAGCPPFRYLSSTAATCGGSARGVIVAHTTDEPSAPSVTTIEDEGVNGGSRRSIPQATAASHAAKERRAQASFLRPARDFPPATRRPFA